jgi:hypothetical protein
LEVDGEAIWQNPGNNPMLFSAAMADIWTDKHVTLTYATCMGTSTLDMKLEVMERVISFYHPGHSMAIVISDRELLDDWQRAADKQMEPEEYKKWHGKADLLEDRRRKISVEMGDGGCICLGSVGQGGRGGSGARRGTSTPGSPPSGHAGGSRTHLHNQWKHDIVQPTRHGLQD